MSMIVDYWFVAVAIGCLLFLCVYTIIDLMQLPKEKKIENVKEWLKYAVSIAEKKLGSGTGSLKLRYVYDLCLAKFPWVARFVTFTMFSKWVDDALVWMKEQLEKNENIANYVGGNNEN